MEDQASSLQLDKIDNGLSSHNGNNVTTMEISDSLQAAKMSNTLNDVDGSNGINLLDAASSTTTEIVPAAQPPIDITKKLQNSSNGVQQAMATESIENHQDDDLIRELEQFEDLKKDDEVAVPKLSTEANGSNLQDTSDLLKDLESDSPCPGPSESENDIAPIESIVGGGGGAAAGSEVLENKKADDVQVDSTTESSNKRKCSLDSFAESAPKRANTDNATEKSSAPDVLNTDTQKSTSEIDSDTESKLLQENSDGEVSMSDVVEAITSTSTVTTKTTTSNDVTSDVKLVDKPNPSNEDLVVSSSGNEDTVKVGSTKDDVKTAQVSAGVAVNVEKSTESKGDDEVSSNKLNDTTEVMEQDFNETIEADRINENVKSATVPNTSATSANESKAKKSTVKSQLDSPALGKASDTVVSSQPDTVDSKQSPMEIDTESNAQSDDATQKCNGLASAATDSKTTSDSKTLPDSGKVDAIPKPVAERIFEIRVSYEENELKSMTVERSTQKSADESTAATSTPPTMHSANGVVELCNFMINHFTELKKSLNVDDESTPKLTTQRGRGSAKKNATQTASPSQATPKSRKRSSTSKRAHDNNDADESESKSKQAKNNSEKSADDDEALEEVKGDCCLARWTDRKYYAGRVIDEKPGNKFTVKFTEDGAVKNLSAEVIVFGVGNVLPLMDHAVHVLVADDTYEPGFVTKIETADDEVQYTVEAESKTVTCPATKIYLMDDQAKAIHHAIKSKEVSMKTPETPSSKRTGRLPAKLEETITTMSGGRSSRGKKGQPIVSPEPGFSGDIDTKKSGRRSNKRPPPPQSRVSESSDLTDPLEDLTRLNSDTALEAISGVQPELQSTPNDSEIYKRNLIAEYLDDDPTRSLDGLLGPMPKQNHLFKGIHFMLTCTVPMKQRHKNQTNVEQFGSAPFFKAHLCSQIEKGGGKVYRFFEEIPANQYRNCKLIAPYPCTTAKYVQSMAANIMPVSHEWIMECCQKNQLLSCDDYVLPSGWSLTDERYINWKVTRSKTSRKGVKALKNVSVMIATLQEDFSTFWARVCKLSGCETSVIESLNDIKEASRTFLLTEDDDCAEEMKSKAEHCKIPVVSTVWVVQSLIVGQPCDPESNPKLKMAYDDEDY